MPTRKKLLTTGALLHVTHDWCQALNDLKTSHVTTALIDMSKAFDRLDPNILIHKLNDLGVNHGLIALIDNFLSQRQCKVKLVEPSAYRDITTGTPKGTKLGPWLWLIYMNDMKVNQSCKLVKYADDLTLYAAFSKSDRSTSPAFQMALDQIAE